MPHPGLLISRSDFFDTSQRYFLAQTGGYRLQEAERLPYSFAGQ